MWMSVQYGDEASQNFTWPTVSAVPPDITAAVRVTTLPLTTVVTGLPPEVTVSVVVVAGGLAKACGIAPHRTIHAVPASKRNRIARR